MVTICSLVARAGGKEDEQVQNMTERMVDYARQCMKSRTRVSPFERACLYITWLFCCFCQLEYNSVNPADCVYSVPFASEYLG